MMTATAVVAEDEEVTLGECQSCGRLENIEDVEYDRIYECNECGGKFTRSAAGSARCENCNKFASRVDSKAGSKNKRNNDVPICSDCETEEMDEVQGYICRYCDDPILTAQYEAHLNSEHADNLNAEEDEDA